MRSIDIDLDVHRAIENARTDFSQSENEILRYLLGIERRPNALRDLQVRPRLGRSSGAYSAMIEGTPIEANTLKELLRRSMLYLARLRPGFLETVATHGTRRGRRLIARTPEALYPTSPHLAGLAEKLDGQWWYDTNVNRQQVQAHIRALCEMAGVPDRPIINKRSEKTTLTLEDMGLSE